MANPSAARISRIPGRLCHTPTNLATAFPHGGTALGTVRDVEWRPEITTFAVHAEEFGGTFQAIQTGESGILSCVVRHMDDDYIGAAFLDTVAGATTGRQVIRGRVKTDGARAGTELTTVALYFSPDDANAHGILLFRAVPEIDAAAKINASLDPEVGLLTLWRATPDDQDRTFEIGPRSDLTL